MGTSFLLATAVIIGAACVVVATIISSHLAPAVRLVRTTTRIARDGARTKLIYKVLTLLLQQCRVLESRLFFPELVDLVLHFAFFKTVELLGKVIGLGIHLRAKGVDLACERVLVRVEALVHRVLDRVCLLDGAKLVIEALLRDVVVDIARRVVDKALQVAAARGNLVADFTPLGLDGVDDGLFRHAELARHSRNGIVNVVDCVLERRNIAVERARQLAEGIAVALYGLHQEFAAGVAVKGGRKTHTAVVHPATTETITKETVSPEHPKQKDYPHPPTTGAAPVVLVVSPVHQCRYERRIRLACRKGAGKHGRDQRQEA